MEGRIEILALLLLVAAVVAMLTHRLRVPYSVGLVAVGIILALLPLTPEVPLTKDILFTVLLPPLIFEAAFGIRWEDLRRDLPVVIVLATVGVMLSAGVTTAGMFWLAHWDWNAALAFGVLIAATDPVSVTATFKQAKAHGRLLLLVESESLFNDGTAAVAFVTVMAMVQGSQPTALGIAASLVATTGGGILCGAAVGVGMLALVGRTQDHLVEITFTTVAAYGSFLLAEQFHMSGVLATLTAGLLFRNFGALGTISARGREAVDAFWEYAAFVANSLVFLLIGMHEARQNYRPILGPALIAIGAVVLGRAFAVYPCCLIFRRTHWRVKAAHQHVLFWGGLRGALALALALALPADMPGREDIITVSFAVVAFSIFVQGLTMIPFLRRLGEIPQR